MTSPPLPSDVAVSADAWAGIQSRITAALALAGRTHPVTLTAVTKSQPWSAIEPLIAAGQITFGENRVQEARDRWSDRRAGLELRLIGPLQTNKVRFAAEFFDVIETLDRPALARALAREAQRAGNLPRVLVQVNTGEEPQKSGVAPLEAGSFIDLCREEFGLGLDGLMCIPPRGEPAAPHFALLAKIARQHGLEALSMGMSDDFETAILLGATAVRIGRALFGPRLAAGMAPRAQS